MSEALDHVADMTRSRDRGLVDATLVAAFLDLLPVQETILWRAVREGGELRYWQRCASQRAGDLVASIDVGPGQYQVQDISALPMHNRALREARMLQEERGEQHCTLLPMSGDADSEGVLELLGAGPLSVAQERVATGVLRIHRNFSSLLDSSERDTLTGLLNRRSFDESLMRLMTSQAPGGVDGAQPNRHWLGVVDLDRFKSINDRFGHLIGDEVLVLVARIMRNSFRYYDRVYRFGGEEFVVLLSAPCADSAVTAFERFRINVEGFAFPRVEQVTVSVGFTEIAPGDAPHAAFQRADTAVYYAKSHGRNQVCFEPPPQGTLPGLVGAGEIVLF